MIVVSDTSPILNLARIGRLQILGELYKHVLIPAAVRVELSMSKYPLIDVDYISWLSTEKPKDWERVEALRANLDAVEAEAIVLAIEHHADLLLIDERRGRRTAEAFGLRITGLIGVLVDARQAGLIDLVKPVLDELIHNARFWVWTATLQRSTHGTG